MRRTIVISQIPPPHHGSTMMTVALLEALNRGGFPCTLVDRRFSRSVSEVGTFSVRKVVSAAWMIPRLIDAIRKDKAKWSILFVTNRPFSFLVDCLLVLALLAARTRLILYIHTRGFADLANRGPLWRGLVGWLLTSASKVVCLGPALAEDIKEWVAEEDIEYIPNTVFNVPSRGPQREAPKEHEGKHNGIPVLIADQPPILYFSNLLPEKGVEDFLKLAFALAPGRPALNFIIVGDKADKALAANLEFSIEAAGLEQQIHIMGKVEDQTVKWDLMRSASLLVFPSSYPYEAQPLTILEALSVGTPVVAYNVGGIRDIIQDGKNGYLVPVNDVSALIALLEALLVDTESLEKIGAAAAEDYIKKYEFQAFQNRWASLMRAVRRSGL